MKKRLTLGLVIGAGIGLILGTIIIK